MRRFSIAASLVLAMACCAARADDKPLNTPPQGFTNLFNGKDLSGWRGRQGTYSPYEEAKLTPDQLAARKKAWEADREKHWRVDQAKGEIVSDGHGVHLTTDKNYGDFEFYVDWLMVSPGGDSGIYLRSYPQVQIWDPHNAREKGNGADKGSGALWNNDNDNPGKWPLVLADNPVGQWNTFHIKMIGSRVWVWFNDKLTVDGQIMDNYYLRGIKNSLPEYKMGNRALPLLPTGPIELQTHGSEIRFRNLYVREIAAEEANATLDKLYSNGFTSIFNGKDFTGWAGPIDNYQIKDGTIMCKPGKGGTIHTAEEYGDFEAKVEFKLPPAGNNGLAIRYPGNGDTAYVGMCELQVLDNTAAVYKNLDPRQFHGSIYGVVPAWRGYLRPVGEWNFEHVIVKGSTITVELNGTPIVQADVKEAPKPYMHNSDHPGLMRTRGFFGFAGHNDPVQFRNVAIKKLGE